MTTLDEALQLFIKARREAEIMKKRLAKLNIEAERAKRAAVDVMLETDTKNHGYDELALKFVRVEALKIETPEKEGGEWRDWIRAQGEEVDDYEVTKLSNSRILKLAKKVYAAEGGLAFGDLRYDPTPNLSVTGWKEYMARYMETHE